jgi:hypothetical protein
MLNTANRFGSNVYTTEELMTDVKNSIWSELKTRSAIDPTRRTLQKNYVDILVNLMNPPSGVITGLPAGFILTSSVRNTDVPSIARAYLRMINSEIKVAVPVTRDTMSKYHLQDVSARIEKALDPKS